MYTQPQKTSDTSEVTQFAASLPDVTAENLRSTWKELARFGLFSQFAPRAFGGQESTARFFCETMMEFGQGCTDSGLAMGAISQIWTVQNLLIQFGTSEQKARYLPKLLAGDCLSAFALTEAAAGSDALSLETSAVAADEGYVLNGSKTFVGMGPVCDVAIVFARTAPEKGRWGLSAFLVHADDKGFIRHPATPKMGLNAVPMGQLDLRDCWVPQDRRIGPEGAGASIIQATLDWERCFILTAQVGAMKRQLEDCVAFAASRNLFGQPINKFQSVTNRLADMRVRLETCELMLLRAAEMYDSGASLTQFAAMVNLHISEAFLSSSMDAVRTFGGRAYIAGSTSGADLNDAVGGVIYSGTSDIQRQIISKMEIAQRARTPKVGEPTNER